MLLILLLPFLVAGKRAAGRACFAAGAGLSGSVSRIGEMQSQYSVAVVRFSLDLVCDSVT